MDSLKKATWIEVVFARLINDADQNVRLGGGIVKDSIEFTNLERSLKPGVREADGNLTRL